MGRMGVMALPLVRTKIADLMDVVADVCLSFPDWEILEIGGTADPKLAGRYVGKTIAQIAREQGRDPFDTYIGILKEDDFNSTILSHSGHEGNVRRIMQHPRHTGGSDGILTSTKPHPRGKSISLRGGRRALG